MNAAQCCGEYHSCERPDQPCENRLKPPPPDYEGFANAIFEAAGWPDACDIDGFQLQEIGVKHGLLVEVQVTEPCGEQCGCAEYHGSQEMAGGVICYRRVQKEGLATK